MTNEEITALEVQYSTADKRVFYAIRQLRLELKTITSAYEELYRERYKGPPPTMSQIKAEY